jgi:hypothetical protein
MVFVQELLVRLETRAACDNVINHDQIGRNRTTSTPGKLAGPRVLPYHTDGPIR